MAGGFGGLGAVGIRGSQRRLEVMGVMTVGVLESRKRLGSQRDWCLMGRRR